MDRQVSSYEAKTNLAALLRRVEKGETITITRRGEEIAELGPTRKQRHARMAAAAERLRERRRNRPKNKPRMSVEEIKAMIHEGHKW